MTYPDKEERRILEAWNEFERGLEPPELAEGVRERLLARRRRRPARYALAIAAAALALAVGALAAAGSFEWLLGSADPRFGEVVEPVGRSSTVEGVRLELIAAQRFGDQAVYYVSLRDTAGLGRVGPDIMWQPIFAGGSTKSELIYFDEAAAAAVYEVRANGVGTEGDAAPLRMERFYYGAAEIDAAADIDLAAVPEVSGGEVDALMHSMDAQPLCAIPSRAASRSRRSRRRARRRRAARPAPRP